MRRETRVSVVDTFHSQRFRVNRSLTPLGRVPAREETFLLAGGREENWEGRKEGGELRSPAYKQFHLKGK